MYRLDPIMINQACELYTAILRQIFDQPRIVDITIDCLGPVQRMPFNNIRAMFQAPFEIKYTLSPAFTRQVDTQTLVMVCTVPGPSFRTLAALDIRIQARKALEYIFPFAEIGDVFGNMPARFGSKGPKLAQHFESHTALFINSRIFIRPQQARIEVFPIHFERYEP